MVFIPLLLKQRIYSLPGHKPQVSWEEGMLMQMQVTLEQKELPWKEAM